MQRIGFVVSPGFQVLSFATSSAFEFANREMGELVYDVRLLSETGGPVRTSMGISVATEPAPHYAALTGRVAPAWGPLRPQA